jgi:hypothetical protein
MRATLGCNDKKLDAYAIVHWSLSFAVMSGFIFPLGGFGHTPWGVEHLAWRFTGWITRLEMAGHASTGIVERVNLVVYSSEAWLVMPSQTAPPVRLRCIQPFISLC